MATRSPKACLKQRGHRRRQRDLRHEHQHRRAAFADRRRQPQVDLGLAAARDAVQQRDAEGTVPRRAAVSRSSAATCSSVRRRCSSTGGATNARSPRTDRARPVPAGTATSTGLARGASTTSGADSRARRDPAATSRCGRSAQHLERPRAGVAVMTRGSPGGIRRQRFQPRGRDRRHPPGLVRIRPLAARLRRQDRGDRLTDARGVVLGRPPGQRHDVRRNERRVVQGRA